MLLDGGRRDAFDDVRLGLAMAVTRKHGLWKLARSR